MKKIIAISLIISLCLSLTAFAANDINTPLNWYFKKTTDHSQPLSDSCFNFINNYNAYYIDKNHNNYSDKEKVIYLTFDAGYENGNITKILDTLKEEDVPGSFFILENLVKRNPDLVNRMYEDGHLICNHTATHKDMTTCETIDDFKCEVERLNDICKDELNIEVAKFYRPPEGRFSEKSLSYANELGYKTVFWSFAYADWDNNNQPSAESALNKLKNGLHNGEILLLHPTSSTNASILKDFIRFAKAEGFRFASLTEL